MIKTSETQNNYFAWLSHQTDVWTQKYMKNKCKQVNKIKAEKIHFASVPSNNIKTISRGSTDKSYLVQLNPMPISVHAGCKRVKFRDISLKSTCLFWSQLQAPMWRSQPRHVIRRLRNFMISRDIKNSLWFYFSTPFLNHSNPIINHIHFGRCLLIIEIPISRKISWIRGGAYANFSKSHVVEFLDLP